MERNDGGQEIPYPEEAIQKLGMLQIPNATATEQGLLFMGMGSSAAMTYSLYDSSRSILIRRP